MDVTCETVETGDNEKCHSNQCKNKEDTKGERKSRSYGSEKARWRNGKKYREKGRKERDIYIEGNSKINNFLCYVTIASHLRRSVYAVPKERILVNDQSGMK